MKCSICKTNRATIHINQFKDGKYIFIDFCETCALKEGLIPQTDIKKLLDEALDRLFENQQQEYQEVLKSKSRRKTEMMVEKERKEKSCTECGFTLSGLKTANLVGCPNDYMVFREKIAEVFKAIHGSTQYEGKIPTGINEDGNIRVNLRKLKAELNQAISVEDFELAAKLRDEIFDIESEIKKDNV